MISGHAAATSNTLFAGEADRDRLRGVRAIAEEVECRHARNLAGRTDTAISQATTVPFGAGPGVQETLSAPVAPVPIEVDSAGEDKRLETEAAATAGDLSTSAATPDAGIR